MEFGNNIDLSSNRIINLLDPVDPQDAATKAFVLANSGGNLNNVVIVNTIADLPVPALGTYNLLADTTYWFMPGVFNIVDTFTLLNNTQIIGFGINSTTIIYTGVGSLFIGVNSNNLIKDLSLSSTTGSLLNINNTVSFSVSLINLNLSTFSSLGQVIGGNAYFDNIKTISACQTGFDLSGALGIVKFDNCLFEVVSAFSPYCIRVQNGSTGISFECYNSNFRVNTTQRGIYIVGTYVLSKFGCLRGNYFYGTGASSTRLQGVNGGSTGWIINFGENTGIAGLQFVELSLSSQTDVAFPNAAGTYIESTTVRGYIKNANKYQDYATIVECKAEILANGTTETLQVGVRNLTDGINVGGLKVAIPVATNTPVDSDYVVVTEDRLYNVYYVKTIGNTLVRTGINLKFKIY